MPKIFTDIPNDELMAKIKRARENIRNKESRPLNCPYCKRFVCTIFSDTQGYIQTKCGKCKTEFVVDLVSMRKLKRKNYN